MSKSPDYTNLGEVYTQDRIDYNKVTTNTDHLHIEEFLYVYGCKDVLETIGIEKVAQWLMGLPID